MHGIHFQTRLLLHCRSRESELFYCSRMITVFQIVMFSYTKTSLSVSFFAPRMRQFQTSRRYAFCARWDSNPRKIGYEPLLDRQMQTSSFGIRYGISSRTSVINTLVGSPLQIHSNIFNMLFHGKKAANSYLSPQFFWLFSFSMTKFLKFSGSITSTRGPKESILITISGSSS